MISLDQQALESAMYENESADEITLSLPNKKIGEGLSSLNIFYLL